MSNKWTVIRSEMTDHSFDMDNVTLLPSSEPYPEPISLTHVLLSQLITIGITILITLVLYQFQGDPCTPEDEEEGFRGRG